MASANAQFPVLVANWSFESLSGGFHNSFRSKRKDATTHAKLRKIKIKVIMDKKISSVLFKTFP